MGKEFDIVQYHHWRFGEYDSTLWTSKRKYKRLTGDAGDLWVEKKTGLVTADPRKLEAWLDKVEGK